MAQLLELGIVRIVHGVFAQPLTGEFAENGNDRVLRRAGHGQVLMADHSRVGRAEAAPLLDRLPVVHLRRDDAAAGDILAVVDPDELAVRVQIRLLEGVQVGHHVPGVCVLVADAVKVVRLDLRHERELRVDLRLRERLNSDNKAALRRHAGGRIRERHRHGDVFRRRTGQRTPDGRADGVVQVWGSERLRVAAGNGDGAVSAVNAKVLHSREENILRGQILAVAERERAAGIGIAQAGRRKAAVQLFLQLGADGRVRADDRDLRGHRLTAQRLEVRVVRITCGVLAERLARELTADRDGLVLRGAGHEQVLVADHAGIGRAEQPPLLAFRPAVHRHGDDAAAGQVCMVIHPDELAVRIQIRLLEGVQVGEDVLCVRVGVADAVKVVRLDLGHERELRVDLRLRERLDFDHEITRSSDAAVGIRERHRDGDVLCRLAGQRAVDGRTRGVVHIRRHDDVFIAARDGHGGVLAVHAKVARGREMNIIGCKILAVALREGQTRHGIAQAAAGGKARVEPGQQILAHGRLLPLDGDIEDLAHSNGLLLRVRELEGHSRGEGDGLVLCGRLDHADIGVKERVRRLLVFVADGDRRRVAGRPGDERPPLAVDDLRQRQILREQVRVLPGGAQALGGELARDLGRDRIAHALHVPADDDRDLQCLGRAGLAERKRDVIATVVHERHGVRVCIEIRDGAVGRDARTAIHFLDLGDADRDAAVVELRAEHRVHVRVPAVFRRQGDGAVEPLDELAQLALGGFLIQLRLRPDADVKVAVGSGLAARERRREGDGLDAAGRQRHDAGGRVDDAAVRARPRDGRAVHGPGRRQRERRGRADVGGIERQGRGVGLEQTLFRRGDAHGAAERFIFSGDGVIEQEGQVIARHVLRDGVLPAGRAGDLLIRAGAGVARAVVRGRKIAPRDLQFREILVVVLAAAEDIDLGAHRLAHGDNALELHGRDLGDDVDREARRDALGRAGRDDRLTGAVGRRLDDHGLVGRARALRRLERDDALALRQRPVDVRVLVHVLAGGGDRRLRLRLIRRAPERVRAGQLDARIRLHHFARLPNEDGVAVVRARRVLLESIAELVRKALWGGDLHGRRCRAAKHFCLRQRIVAIFDRGIAEGEDAALLRCLTANVADAVAVFNAALLQLADDAACLGGAGHAAGVVAIADRSGILPVAEDAASSRSGHIGRVHAAADGHVVAVQAACNAAGVAAGHAAGKAAVLDRSGLHLADDAANIILRAAADRAGDVQVADRCLVDRSEQALIGRAALHVQAADRMAAAIERTGKEILNRRYAVADRLPRAGEGNVIGKIERNTGKVIRSVSAIRLDRGGEGPQTLLRADLIRGTGARIRPRRILRQRGHVHRVCGQCRRHEAEHHRQHQQQGQKPFFHVLSSQNKKILPAGIGGQVQQNQPNEIPSFSHATSGSGRNACSLRVF